jgi:hypothetical protein
MFAREYRNKHIQLRIIFSLDGAHCKDKMPKFQISKQIFPEKEYRGLSPNFHIHASVSDLYIPTIGLSILLEEICRLILGLYT